MFVKRRILVLLLLASAIRIEAQKIVRYDLYVKDTLVNYSGRSAKAVAINGQIPAPTLTFTEGDTAEIYIHNQLHFCCIYTTIFSRCMCT